MVQFHVLDSILSGITQHEILGWAVCYRKCNTFFILWCPNIRLQWEKWHIFPALYCGWYTLIRVETRVQGPEFAECYLENVHLTPNMAIYKYNVTQLSKTPQNMIYEQRGPSILKTFLIQIQRVSKDNILISRVWFIIKPYIALGTSTESVSV